MISNTKNLFIFFALFLFWGCKKEENNKIYLDSTKTIKISDGISVDNGFQIHDPNLNLKTYDAFLRYLSSSNHFKIVTQREFPSATSNDKVIISFRYDIDDNINAAIKFAYLEKKYGIKSTYYILHSAGYYGVTKLSSFKRNDNIIKYIQKIQNDFGHEIGLHNDLVTLQVVFNIDSREYLKNELDWLRSKGIIIYGAVAHGREYCYQYHYVNSYFWNHTKGSSEGFFYNWEYVPIYGEYKKIEKDDLSSYNLEYDGDLLNADYRFADSNRENGKLWYMGKVNFDTIQPGKKVIILLHPQHWD